MAATPTVLPAYSSVSYGALVHLIATNAKDQEDWTKQLAGLRGIKKSVTLGFDKSEERTLVIDETDTMIAFVLDRIEEKTALGAKLMKLKRERDERRNKDEKEGQAEACVTM